ncbi:MAG TPA: sugar ABC transporter permease [Stackebrandtia sp.]|jgi:multiple sugar transport system permease protein|uniref:carbohydrate ABC transporter permease n=1 Tax=Stackebrandtia sp. TaxID=2023065 RepID=UPI002D4E6623|nr:sugar ABC transporter permease [Stackebrandtia sp.]HZE40643.1 sugar ABC transporter permease [Stackebrandtia sp.]
MTALMFLAPALLFFAVLFYLPIGNALVNSLNTGPQANVYNGVGNYTRAFTDPDARNAFVVTLLFAVGTTVGSIVCGLGLAVLLDRQLPGRTLIRAILLVPYLTSVAIVGLLWRNILDPDLGILNRCLDGLGLPHQQWLTTHPLATIIAVTLWHNVGYTMVLFLAGLQGIPDEYQEAARLDGAGAWQRFWRITLPLLTPTTLFVSVMTVIGGLQAFGQAYIITGGGPAGKTDLYIFHVFNVAIHSRDFGYADALAVLMLVVIIAVTIGQLRAARRGEIQY